MPVLSCLVGISLYSQTYSCVADYVLFRAGDIDDAFRPLSVDCDDGVIETPATLLSARCDGPASADATTLSLGFVTVRGGDTWTA